MTQIADQLGAHVLLGIPTLSTARRSTAWFDSLAGLQMPLGTSMARLWSEDLPIAASRNRLCQAAIDNGAKYLLFLSDDVLPPPNMILAMLSKIGREYPVEDGKVARASMITGVYWTKTTPAEPYLWNEMLGGSFKDWRVGEFFPINFAGCDALMIEVEALKSCPQPWFSTDWAWEEGQQPSPIATEDFFFYTQMRKAGHRLFVDTSLQCRHEDRASGQQFGLTMDMPQALDERPPAEFKGKYVADIGAGFDSPFMEGARLVRFDGDVAVRPDVRCDLRAIPELYTGTFDVVHSRHVLEHFARREAPAVVAHWAQLLVPGGELIIRVPNIGWAIERFLDEEASAAERAYAWDQFYGAQRTPYDFHKNGFTERKLAALLRTAAPLEDVTVTLEDEGQNLCARARYTGPVPVPALIPEWKKIRQSEGAAVEASPVSPGGDASSPRVGEGVASSARPNCDVCGQLATNGAQDMVNETGPLDVVMRYRPLPYIKNGCDEHPVESITYERSVL